MRRVAVMGSVLVLLVAACGGDDEGGTTVDASQRVDAAVNTDGPVADAPVADAPVADAATPDAAVPDAMPPDAMLPDAGPPPDALPGTQVTLNASMDATICIEGTTDGAIGDGSLFVGRTRVSSVRRALVRFDLSGLPSSVTILDASLELTVEKNKGMVTAQAFRVTTDWAQGPAVGSGDANGGCVAPGASDASWNQTGLGGSWTTAGADFANTSSGQIAVSAASTVRINSASMISDVQGWLDGTFPSYGWILVATDESTDSRVLRIVSPPKLLVRYQ